MRISTHFPKTIVTQAQIIEQFPEYLPTKTKRILIISGEKSWQAVQSVIELELKAQSYVYEQVVLKTYPTQKVIQEFALIVEELAIEAVIAIGGGRVCDVAKAVVDEKPCFLMMIPTIAATNAAFRKNSMIYDERGAYQNARNNRLSPDVLLIDPSIISQAPKRYLVAGMVDAISRSVDTKPYTVNRENQVLAFIYQNAQLATNYLLEMGERLANKKLTKDEQLQTIEAIIVGVGVAGAKTKGRLYRGVTHPLHNELTGLVQTPALLHGEIIAFTTLVQLLLEKTDYKWFVSFLKKCSIFF